MGWMSVNLRGSSPVEYIKRECLVWPYKEGREINVLAIKQVEDVVYAAIEVLTLEKGTSTNGPDFQDRRVTAFIFFTEKYKKDEHGCDFSYKDLSEADGPFGASKCPKAILKLLTPTESEYANNWRQSCYDYHDSKKKVAAQF